MFFTVLTISKYILILQCVLTRVNTVACEDKVYLNVKPPGESYGSRIQRLEDSIVYKLDHPSKGSCKSIIEDMEACANLLGDFCTWLRLDDREEIKYAQDFIKNGVPKIVFRNYTATRLLKEYNLNPLEMLTFLNAIRKFAEAWVYFRDPLFQYCYNNEEEINKLFDKYEAEGKFPQLKFTTDDEAWPTEEDEDKISGLKPVKKRVHIVDKKPPVPNIPILPIKPK